VAQAPLAEPLKAEAGSPALQLVRRYLDSSNDTFEISITTHPADRFTLLDDDGSQRRREERLMCRTSALRQRI